MRSKLFVPGVRPDLFGKAWAGAADAVSFDLEDAVADGRKAEARAAVAAFLQAQTRGPGAPLTIVRVNAADSAHYDADLAAVLPAAPDLVNLPKADDADAVRAAITRLEAQEIALGLAPSAGLLLNIETPRALRNAAAIAAAHPRVAGLQLGLGDLFEPSGIRRDVSAHVQAVMLQVALAAAEAGVFACDGAWGDLEDDAGFAREALLARQLGFVGKSCIHPRQVPLAHAAFAVDPAELHRAQRIVDGAAEARRDGRAVCVVDGRMIDAPYLRRAERVLAQADRDARADTGSST